MSLDELHQQAVAAIRPVHQERVASDKTDMPPTLPRAASTLQATGPQVIGALAVCSLAIGVLAIGAFAIGRLAIGRLAIGRARIRHLDIDELTVRKLKVTDAFSSPPRKHFSP
jgi:hypothetical protein